jgi:hypothetical protein
MARPLYCRQNAAERQQIRLADDGFRTRSLRCGPDRSIVPLRNKDDSRVGERLENLARGGKPIHSSHLHIHQDKIGPMRSVCFERFSAILAFHDVRREIRDEYADHLSHSFTVIDDHYLHTRSWRLKNRAEIRMDVNALSMMLDET